MTDWQPIETAPKDGTTVLLAYKDELLIGWYQDEQRIRHGQVISSTKKWTGYGVFDRIYPSTSEPPPEPTHWMPLPKPPEVK